MRFRRACCCRTQGSLWNHPLTVLVNAVMAAGNISTEVFEAFGLARLSLWLVQNSFLVEQVPVAN